MRQEHFDLQAIGKTLHFVPFEFFVSPIVFCVPKAKKNKPKPNVIPDSFGRFIRKN